MSLRSYETAQLLAAAFFFLSRSKYKVKLLNPAKRAVFPLFSLAAALAFPFKRKRGCFGSPLMLCLPLPEHWRAGGLLQGWVQPGATLVLVPGWSLVWGLVKPGASESCWCCTVGLCSSKIFLSGLKSEHHAVSPAACGSAYLVGPEPSLRPACKNSQ